MKEQQTAFLKSAPLDTWNEELSRARKYKEATQKRNELKLAQKELETAKKKTAIGRLKIEP